MPTTFKNIIAGAVRRAVLKIQWEDDPFAKVKMEAVKDKPLETTITIKTNWKTYKYIVQVREIK